MPAAKNSIQVGDEFSRSGYGVVVIWRENDIVVLRATWKGDRALETLPEPSHYQVQIVRVYPPEIFKNDSYTERESLRGNEAWGKYAWTYHTEAQAMRKAAGLLKAREAEAHAKSE